MNSSTESPCSQVVSTLFIAITSIISFVAFTGNILVTVAFLKTQSLRTSINYYIVNMVISDILCSCFGWLLYATEGMLTSSRVLIKEPSASDLCKLGMYSRAVSQVVSVLSLVLITVDRYIAVVFPFKTTTLDQGKVRLILLLFTWLIPIAFCCPYILYAKVVTVDGQTFCRLLWNLKSAFAIFNGAGFVIFYCIPLITITILFSRILKALRECPIAQKDKQGPVNNNRRRQHQKITKILISIVVAFFVCWTPLCVYLALKMFLPDLFLKDKCHILVALFFYVFPSLNSAINPLILFLFSTNYRQALTNLCSGMYHIIHLYRNKRIAPLHVTSVQMKELH